MGTSVRIIHHVLRKAFPRGIPRALSYLDLGAQQLYGDTPQDYLDFYRWAGQGRSAEQTAGGLCDRLSRRSRADWEAAGDGGPRASVGDLFAPLEWDYHSVDLSGGTLPWDLNVVVAEPHFLGHFDVVANYGTTEHVFNQHNCFNLVHDITKPGGIMVHFLPIGGYLYHCLFKYDPKFFLLLGNANDYELLHAGFGSNEGADRVDERHQTWANYQHMSDYPFPNFLAEFIFRKPSDHPFAMPYDMVNTDLAIRYDFPVACSSVR